MMSSIKLEVNQSQIYFNQWTESIRELSPRCDSLPKDFYQVKRLVSKLGLKEEKIDYCLKRYMLFYKDDATLTHYKFCEEHKFKLTRSWSKKYKDVP